MSIGRLIAAIGCTTTCVVLRPTAEVAASQPTVLATYHADAAAWSPTRRELAFLDHGRAVVVDVGAAGGAERCRAARPAAFADRDRAGAQFENLAWSPDGRRLVFVGTRSTDQWATIWMTTADCADPIDLLASDSPFVSPGVRALGLSAWLSPTELAFVAHCGSDCVELASVAVEPVRYARFCAAEGEFFWAPSRTRAAVGLHLGGVGIVESRAQVPVRADSINFCEAVLAGCDVVDGRERGVSHTFEGWAPNGRVALVSRRDCPPQGPLSPGADLLEWNPDTKQAARLFANAGHAAFAPDGRSIAFILFGAPARDGSGRVVGSTVPKDGAVAVGLAIGDELARRINHVIALGTLGPIGAPGGPRVLREQHPGDYQPSWSPDGRHIVSRTVSGSVVLVSADGTGEPVELGRGEALWSADGSMIAFVDRRSDMISILDIR